jgi:hypothetical protein
MKYAFLILAISFCLSAFSNPAEAGSGFFLGFSRHHPYYYHYRPHYWGGYYSHFYRPYYYRPYFYSPFGYGYGYGHGGYGYGPGYGFGGYGYGYGEVRLEVKPKTAKVYVDGAYAGVVDDFDGWYQRLEVSPGAHKIVVREPGFTPYVETIRALPGQDVHIKHHMRPGSDTISERDMVLERDERDDYRRRDDRYKQRDEDYDRERRRDRNRDDYDRDNYDRDDDDYQYQRYEKESRSLPRTEAQLAQNDTRAIILQVQPADATVYIDGNDYGTSDAAGGDLQVLLPEGIHKLEVVRPGYRTFTQELNVKHDSNDRVVVNLEKK